MAPKKTKGGGLDKMHTVQDAQAVTFKSIKDLRDNKKLPILIRKLLAFATKITGDETLAGDLVNDALERALRGEHDENKFQEGTRLDSYLFNAIQNRYRDILRSRKVRNITESFDMSSDQHDRGMLGVEKITPEDIAGDRATLAALMEAVKTLSPESRALMELYLDQEKGYSYEEIAAKLGIPIGTVMSRLSRARGELRKKIGRE